MGLFLLFDFVNGAQGSLVCMCLKQKCWVLADGHFLLVYGQTISWSGGCSNICLHHQSVGVTTSYILILCWLSDLVLTWRIYLIASSGLISYVFSAFRKTLGKKKALNKYRKKSRSYNFRLDSPNFIFILIDGFLSYINRLLSFCWIKACLNSISESLELKKTQTQVLS